MTEDTWLFLVCHIYAFIFGFAHIVIITGLALLWFKKWALLAVYATLLSMSNQITLPKLNSVIRFFVPALGKLFGGVEIIRNDVTVRERQKTERPRPILYAVHPHAIAANGLGFAMADCVQRGERVTVAVSTWLWYFNPLFKWFLNAMGLGLTTVTRLDLSKAMARGDHIAILPGGFDESLLMEPHRDVVCIQQRAGFLKYAMRYGYDVVPVFLFGESRLYSNGLIFPEFIRKHAAKARIPLVLPKGRTMFSLLPDRPEKGLRIVFGDPLHAAQYSDLRQLHRSYISAVKGIFEDYNVYPDTSLLVR